MKEVLKELNKILDEVGSWQNADGSIKEAFCPLAHEKLKIVPALVQSVCEEIGQEQVAAAIALDMENWFDCGLKNAPSFVHTVLAFKAPQHGERSFFWGPLRLANAGDRRGYFLRAFLSECDEPKELEILSKKFPHPKNVCQPTHLLWGSKDIVNGNNVVFFPENIACSDDVVKQEYAAFFFNKHYGLYQNITLKTAHKIMPHDIEFFSEKINERETYIARCIWGYLHDYFHHQGRRPLNENLQIKIKRFTGLLEETKVDMQTYLTCRSENFPFSNEVAEFVMLERLFRYPQESDYKINFDSGTGLLALSYFLQNGGILVENDCFKFKGNFDEVVQALVFDIEQIEAIEDDREYILAAEKFVYNNLHINQNTREFIVPSIILKSPISTYLGQGKIVKNLNNVEALEKESKNWVEHNVVESEKVVIRSEIRQQKQLAFRDIYNDLSLGYQILLTQNEAQIIFGADIAGQYKKVDPANDDDLAYARSRLSPNHPNREIIKAAEEQRSRIIKRYITSSLNRIFEVP